MEQLIIQLLLAHLIGDFVLQPSSWIENKKKNLLKSPYLYYHTIIHVLLLIVTLNFKLEQYGITILIIGISHILIDIVKLYASKKGEKWWFFWLDQSAHIAIITLVVFFHFPFTIDIEYIYSIDILLLITMTVFVTMVSSIIIKVMIGNLYIPPNGNDSIPNAGTYIGMLERILIFTFIVLNYWQPIGFLIAAKSIFRFGDLSKEEERKKTEYILIGTFLSFSIAIASGIFYRYTMVEDISTLLNLK